ncbi:MAG TPA: hypothetical protein VFW38_09875 [Solirubrobacteraceae bacterium]|nr:hypothetical protein [Solirubrobacteraceae bacterium]
MGLLDDAIREHLELKRLRGADEGEVARAEDEALGQVQHQTGTPIGDEAPAEKIDANESGSQTQQAPEPEKESQGQGGISQETVEIDMEQALAGDPAPAESRQASQAGDNTTPVAHPAHAQPSSGDSLEWEMPGDRAKDEASDEVEDEEPVEDVLEETPDFLRETPEHERLWFEQRPPRDFDFNE